MLSCFGNSRHGPFRKKYTLEKHQPGCESVRGGVDARRSDFCLAKQSKNGARAGWRILRLGKWTPVTAGCDGGDTPCGRRGHTGRPRANVWMAGWRVAGGDTPVWPLRYRAVPMFRLENNRCGKSFFPMGEVGEAQRRRMLGVVCPRGTPPRGTRRRFVGMGTLQRGHRLSVLDPPV